MSTKDISKGLDWFRNLQEVLVSTRICIICVTRENVRSPWIYYETGAIATNGPDVLVCPYLLSLSPSMLADGPLGKWQCTVAERDDTWELIKSLNQHALGSKHDAALLEGNFQARWPDFSRQLESIADIETTEKYDFIETDADELAGFKLSSEARTMILEVSKDEHALLLFGRASGTFQTNGKNICTDQRARTIANWKGALNDLVDHGLLEPRGQKGEVFALTRNGFGVADAISGN